MGAFRRRWLTVSTLRLLACRRRTRRSIATSAPPRLQLTLRKPRRGRQRQQPRQQAAAAAAPRLRRPRPAAPRLHPPAAAAAAARRPQGRGQQMAASREDRGSALRSWPGICALHVEQEFGVFPGRKRFSLLTHPRLLALHGRAQCKSTEPEATTAAMGSRARVSEWGGANSAGERRHRARDVGTCEWLQAPHPPPNG